MSEVDIAVQPTPNPNAIKFILDQKVKDEGNSSYRSPMECMENTFATALFTIRGVDQVHFFANTITITKFGYEDWDEMIPIVEDCVQVQMPNHKPDYFDPDPEAERRRQLGPELLEIEKILDRTIRPSLQADGGDLIALTYEDDVLIVQYQGACGTCPSSTGGTLEAIKSILRDEFSPKIDVFIAPEM